MIIKVLFAVTITENDSKVTMVDARRYER